MTGPLKRAVHLPTLVVGGIFFLIGASFGAVGFHQLGAGEGRLASEGRAARAEVLGKAIHANRTAGSRVRPAYRVNYRFAPAGAEWVTAAAEIEPGLWSRLAPGQRLEVVYLPADPSSHRVTGERRDRTLAGAFVLIGLAFAPLGAWLMRGAVPSGSRLAATGVATRPGRGDRLGAWIARSPAFAFGVGAIVFFSPFALAGLAWLASTRAEQAQFASSSRSVDGMVLSKAVVTKRSSTGNRPSRPTRHYHVSYRFLADAGEELVGTSAVAPDAWERFEERGPIALRYVAGRPWLHRLEGEGPNWTGPLVFLSLGGLGMLGGTLAAFRGWPRWSRAAPRPGAHTPRPTIAPPSARVAPPVVARGPSRWALVFGGVFCVAGVAALGEGWAAVRQERRYAAEGRLAEARITEKAIRAAERHGRTRTEYVARYRFTTREGRTLDGEAILDVAAWEAARPGDPIRARYLSSAPQTNRAAEESGVAGGIALALVGAVFVAAGAGIAAAGWWRPRRAARAERSAPP